MVYLVGVTSIRVDLACLLAAHPFRIAWVGDESVMADEKNNRKHQQERHKLFHGVTVAPEKLKKAVEEGNFSEMRYDGYLRIMADDE